MDLGNLLAGFWKDLGGFGMKLRKVFDLMRPKQQNGPNVNQTRLKIGAPRNFYDIRGNPRDPDDSQRN